MDEQRGPSTTRALEPIRSLRACAAVLACATIVVGVAGLMPALARGAALRCFGLGLATGGAVGVLFFLLLTRKWVVSALGPRCPVCAGRGGAPERVC